jgi:hypothetical protein
MTTHTRTGEGGSVSAPVRNHPPAQRSDAKETPFTANYTLMNNRGWISDDMDTGFAGPEGEIQYLAVVATGNRGETPIIVQRTGFPLENWYEAEDNGVNAVFLAGQEKAIPLFCFREDQMGNELVITFTVVDEDETAEIAIIGHSIAAAVGTGVATAMAGPAVGTLVNRVSSAVQSALEEGQDLDVIGTHINNLRRADNFGMPQNGHAVTIDATNGKIRLRYTVMRITVPQEYDDWCLSVTLNEVKILEDADGFLAGGGEIYIRARVADRYVGELLHQTSTNLPESGTTIVDAGNKFPVTNKQLYFNQCHGLPPFVFIEVDVFESDDDPQTPGRTGDDVLGVLPLMFTNRWLREHPGQHEYTYTVTGNDPSSEKARIRLTISVWDPHEGPF